MKTRIAPTLLLFMVSYTAYFYPRCNVPTHYKSCSCYTIYLTTPENDPDDFYLVLTSNQHGHYGGQCHGRAGDEPIIRFEKCPYLAKTAHDKTARVKYQDFKDAIHSDQPAHNVRVRTEGCYITLSKICAREFRNGFAGKELNKIVASMHKNSGT